MESPEEKLHDVVHVKFFDTAGQLIGQSKMPHNQLPATFELKTRIHLLDNDWAVVEAHPKIAADFRREGKLVLILEKVQITDG